MAFTADHFDRLAAQMPGLGRDAAAVRLRIEAMERVLERLFVVPGLNRPIGLDAIIGMVPIVGGLCTSALGAWIVWEARNLGLSKWQLARMAGNIGVDTLLGAIPFIGVVPDYLFRSNTRNLRIIRRHLDRHHPATATIEGTVQRDPLNPVA